MIAFGSVTLVFVYTLVAKVIEQPNGIKFASFFIGGVICTRLSRR